MTTSAEQIRLSSPAACTDVVPSAVPAKSNVESIVSRMVILL
jgi:hypothetical protein